MDRKVIVIGLNGAIWSLIKEGIKKEKLPIFDKVKKKGYKEKK